MGEAKSLKGRFETIKKFLMENEIILVLVIIIAAIAFFAFWNWSLKAGKRHIYEKCFSVECQKDGSDIDDYTTTAETNMSNAPG